MVKREVYCDVCGEKIGSLLVTRMTILEDVAKMAILERNKREMDLCKKCTTWLLDLIADRQMEKSATRE